MSIFDLQNADEGQYAGSSWLDFLKYAAICSVLSMFIAALSTSSETRTNLIRMAVYVVFVSFAIMIFPLLIGAVTGLFKKNQNFALLFSWIIIASLLIIGMLA